MTDRNDLLLVEEPKEQPVVPSPRQYRERLRSLTENDFPTWEHLDREEKHRQREALRTDPKWTINPVFDHNAEPFGDPAPVDEDTDGPDAFQLEVVVTDAMRTFLNANPRKRRCGCGDPGCAEFTGRFFAPGHDARMVGLLARLVADGTATEDAAVRNLRRAGGTEALEAKLRTAIQNKCVEVNRSSGARTKWVQVSEGTWMSTDTTVSMIPMRVAQWATTMDGTPLPAHQRWTLRYCRQRYSEHSTLAENRDTGVLGFASFEDVMAWERAHLRRLD